MLWRVSISKVLASWALEGGIEGSKSYRERGLRVGKKLKDELRADMPYICTHAGRHHHRASWICSSLTISAILQNFQQPRKLNTSERGGHPFTVWGVLTRIAPATAATDLQHAVGGNYSRLWLCQSLAYDTKQVAGSQTRPRAHQQRLVRLVPLKLMSIRYARVASLYSRIDS